MTAYLLLPYYFFSYWFYQAPISIIGFFYSLNKAYFSMFSLSLLLRTFFQPLKNEYRKGLIGFSVGMGIAVKLCLIFTSFLIFIPLLIIEAVLLVVFICFPIITVGLLIF